MAVPIYVAVARLEGYMKKFIAWVLVLILVFANTMVYVEGNSETQKTSHLSSFPIPRVKPWMPSIGDVGIVVIPIQFEGYGSFTDAYLEQLQSEFFYNFEDHHDREYLKYNSYNNSISEIFKIASYGKMNVYGDVLPVYTTPRAPNSINSLKQLVREALDSYTDIDFSKYDGNGDGYIDAVCVQFYQSTWPDQPIFGRDGEAVDIDHTLPGGMKTCSVTYNFSHTYLRRIYVNLHELAHCMGLPDNYYDPDRASGINNLGLPLQAEEVMDNTITYFNILYRYFLGWVDPVVLTYSDDLQDIDLYAVEQQYFLNNDEPKAIILIPDNYRLPLDEYFIIEYRAGSSRFSTRNNDDPGIYIWHVRTQTEFNPIIKYLEPMEAVLTDIFYDLSFRVGDEFSDTSTPRNSRFDNNVYTGAYLKVLAMDNDKATLRVGFKDVDKTPKPRVTISEPSKPVVKYGGTVSYTVTLESDSDITYPMMTFDLLSFFSLVKTETADARILRTFHTRISGSKAIITVDIVNASGDGTIGVSIKPNLAWYDDPDTGTRIYSMSAASTTFIVDSTPPQITLYGPNPQVIPLGSPYVELGAGVTDNLDEDPTLTINSSYVNTAQLGTYYVYYTATDHSGNTAYGTRTVKVEIVTSSYNPTLSLSASPASGQIYPGDVTLTVALSDADNNAGKTILFNVNGVNSTAVTDSSGIATLTLPALNAGTYTFGAAFTGGGVNNPAAAADVTDYLVARAVGVFSPLTARSATYTTSLKLSDITLPTGYAWVTPATALSVGDGQSFPATYTDPSGNYTTATGSIVVNVAKATGTFPTLTARSATYTTTLKLSDITLPSGYAWVTPTTTLTVADNGNTFSATYTDPSGNYTTAIGNIVVNVAKATGTFPTLTARSATYTTSLKLSDVTLPTGYTWAMPTTPLTVSDSGNMFSATYTDPSGNYTTATGSIVVNVAKATGIFPTLAVQNVTYTATLKLSDITLPLGYAWSNPATPLTVADSGNTFPATYTDPSGNYTAATGSIVVNVLKLIGMFPELAAQSATYTATLKLSDVTLPAGYAWVTPAAALKLADSGKWFFATYTDPSGIYTTAMGSIAVNLIVYKIADINTDGDVNILDLSILLANFGKRVAEATYSAADINGDGDINVLDLSILLANFGK